MIDELEHNLAIGLNGIQQLSNEAGMNNRILEWLLTPEGTMPDKPRWGSPLRAYQFDTPSSRLAVEIELSLVRKMLTDISDVTIRRIVVIIDEIDLLTLQIQHEYGIFRVGIPFNEVING